MPRQERTHAAPIWNVTDRTTGEVVGWVYRWDTGEQAVMMRASLDPDVEREARPRGDPSVDAPQEGRAGDPARGSPR